MPTDPISRGWPWAMRLLAMPYKIPTCHSREGGNPYGLSIAARGRHEPAGLVAQSIPGGWPWAIAQNIWIVRCNVTAPYILSLLSRGLFHLLTPRPTHGVIPLKTGIHSAFPLPQAPIFNPQTREINFQPNLKNPFTCNFFQPNLPTTVTH